jgi:hypothetical protein
VSPEFIVNTFAFVSVTFAVAVALLKTVKLPVPFTTRFANDELPVVIVFVPELPFKVTVPPFATKPFALMNDPPIVNVPDGSVVVPAANVTVPVAVALTSRILNVPAAPI